MNNKELADELAKKKREDLMTNTPSQHTPEFIYGELVRLLNIPQRYLRPSVNNLCIELLRKEMSFNPRMFELLKKVTDDLAFVAERCVENQTLFNKCNADVKQARQIIAEIEK